MTFLRQSIPVFLFFIFVFPRVSNAQEMPEPNLKAFQLLDQVKSVKSQSFDWKDAEKIPNQNLELHFNSEGLLIQRSLYDADQNLNEENLFKYDQHGNRIEEIYTDNQINKATYRSTVAFNDDHKMIRQINYNPDGTQAQSKVLEYDANGLLTTIKETLHNSESSSKKTFKYDDNGNKTEEIVYHRDIPKRKSVFKIHQGKVVEIKEFRNHSADGENWAPNYKTTFQYDASGNPIERKEVSYNLETSEPSGETVEKTTYNEQGIPIAVQIEDRDFEYDNRNQSESKTFDKYGNLLTYRDEYNGEVRLHQTYKYEYDDHNNWTSMTKMENGEPQSMEKREIIYFE